MYTFRGFNRKTSKLFSIFLLLVFISFSNISGCHGDEDEVLDIVSIDFNATTAIDCTGAFPTKDDIKMFQPIIYTSNVIPIPPVNEPQHILRVYIKSGSTVSSDIIGEFTVTIKGLVLESSNNYGMDFKDVTMLANPGGIAPPTSVGIERYGFWMTCTSDCSVRSNLASSGRSSAPIFLELLPESMNGNVKLTGNLASPIHGISCPLTSP